MRWTDFHPLDVRHVQNTSMQCVRIRLKISDCPFSVSISVKGNVVGISCRGMD